MDLRRRARDPGRFLALTALLAVIVGLPAACCTWRWRRWRARPRRRRSICCSPRWPSPRWCGSRSTDRAAAVRAAAAARAAADARSLGRDRPRIFRDRTRDRRAALGLRAPAPPRRRGYEPRPAPLFAAPGQRRAPRRQLRAAPAACVGDLGRRGDRPLAGGADAGAAPRVMAADRRGRVAGRCSYRDGGRRAPGGAGANRADVDGPADRRRLRTGAGARQWADAAAVPDRAPDRVLPRLADAGDRDVSVAAGARDGIQGAADRHDVRAAGGVAARGFATAAAAGGRSDRCDPVARRVGAARRRHGPGRSDTRVRRVVADRPGQLSSDLGGGVVWRRRAADQRLSPQPPGVRDDPSTAPPAAAGTSRSTKCRRSDRANATCCVSPAASASAAASPAASSSA